MHYPHKIIKRDGRTEQFDERKVYNAVYQAALANSSLSITAEHLAGQVTEHITKNLNENKSVSNVQKMIEDFLMSNPKTYDIARTYIEYRHDRDKVREANSKLYLDIEGFLEQSSDEFTKENANKPSEIVCTHRDLLAGILSKNYAEKILPPVVVKYHKLGAIHMHDLDYLITPSIHNCGVYNFQDMLENGFHLGDAKIESPKSIGTATTLLSQICSAISGSSYGGQSVHEYDKLLRPYAEKSLSKLRKEAEEYSLPDSWVKDKLRKEIFDAHQTFIYQISTICGSSGQSAFASISLSLSEDPLCKLIKEEYLKCHMEGLGKDGRTSIFPKVLYFVEKGINLEKEDPNYEEFKLALKCSALRMYPDYIMAPNNRKMTGANEVISPMGCRSYVSDFKDKSGQSKYVGRFNLGVCSISIPYAALLAKGDVELFFKYLDELCEISYQANMFRVERFKKTKAKQNPILWMEGALARLNPEESVEDYLYGGNATISLGYVGLAEAKKICGDNSKNFGLEILTFLKNKTVEFTSRCGISWSPYGSPMESGAYRLMNLLKISFPEYESEREYLTNSFHTPVWEKLNFIEKFELESNFYLLSNGGNVNNIEIPNMLYNLEGLESVIKCAYDKVQYLIINQPTDRCFICGYKGEFKYLDEKGFCCPTCKNNDPKKASCVARVSGYIYDKLSRPANRGKTKEIVEREKNIENLL